MASKRPEHAHQRAHSKTASRAGIPERRLATTLSGYGMSDTKPLDREWRAGPRRPADPRGRDLSVCRPLFRASGRCRRPRGHRGVGNPRTRSRPRLGFPQGSLSHRRLGVCGTVRIGRRRAASGTRSHPRVGLAGLALRSAPQRHGVTQMFTNKSIFVVAINVLTLLTFRW